MSFNPKSALIRILEDRPPESNLEGAARELAKATQPLVELSDRALRRLVRDLKSQASQKREEP